MNHGVHGLRKRRGAPIDDDDDVHMRLKLKRHACGRIADTTRRADALRRERRAISPVLLFPSSPPPPAQPASHDGDILRVPAMPAVLAGILGGGASRRSSHTCMPTASDRCPDPSDAGSEDDSVHVQLPPTPDAAPLGEPATLATISAVAARTPRGMKSGRGTDSAQSGSVGRSSGGSVGPVRAVAHARELFWAHPKSRVVKHLKAHVKGGSVVLPREVYARKSAGPGAVGGWVPPPLPPCVAALVSPSYRGAALDVRERCPLCSEGEWDAGSRSPSPGSTSTASVTSTGSSGVSV